MSFSMQKFIAVFQMKFSAIIKNRNIIVAPLMAIGFVLLMGLLMPDEAMDHEMGLNKAGFLLSFGLSFNIIMGGIMMASYPLAEEKEKKTLRVLMTSSVSSLEFFLASILPSLLIMTIVNVALIPAANVSFSAIPVVTYLLVTTICGAISLMIGLVIGISAKDQMQAGIAGMPIMLILTLLPMFSIFNETLGTIGSFTYPGVLNNFVQATLFGTGFQWGFKELFVLLAWVIISAGVFMYAYRKNGLDE
ncbi:ABC transporter permease [Vagococcus sp. BWB3-3]|uniref:ABC transporter permease n=1 Tax=Vagococcus allomyrinae TaxID=2794353 RepID=A0A940SV56_9ENTE|nr:ABC transporter permease [Vagococcus allomyrinae]MBP1040003.1 ABC transporter permease [Vagococcus allomyrinae]